MNLLAADIGGTKTLLGIYEINKRPLLLYKVKYKSNEWPNFNLILNNFLENLPEFIKKPTFGCIGVAGIVKNQNVSLTNLSWRITVEV